VGYLLSILSRPLVGFTASLALIFTGRSIDRIGKGIRSGARDALLAEECQEENRAEVFGFHRSMDTAGAILGPLVAMVYLYFHPADYRTIFIITLAPGILASLCTFLLKEKTQDVVTARSFSFRKNFSFYKEAPSSYLKFLGLLLLFGIANSSDMFLLLRAKETGLSEVNVILLYMLFNLMYAVFAFPIGKLADKYGRMNMLIIGLIIYTITYLIFGYTQHIVMISAAFIGYGLYYAFTQSTLKALLLERVDASQKSSAIGFYEGVNSFFLLGSNALAGWVWYQFGATSMFTYSSVIAFIVLLLMIRQSKSTA
jgi:MFS family permease